MMSRLTVRQWIGWLVMACLLALHTAVIHEWLPFPSILTAEMSSRSIGGVPYRYTVPPESIVREGDAAYVFVVRKSDNYWLDGTYAYKTEVKVLKQDQRFVAIEFVDPGVIAPDTRAVVMNPSPHFHDIQKVRAAPS